MADIGGAVQGAGTGAATGAAGGPWGAVIGAGAGLVGSLLGRRKPKKPDLTAVTNEINNSAKTQSGFAAGLKDRLAPLSTQYNTDAGALSKGLVDKTKTMADQYVVDQEGASKALNRNLSDTLKQNVLSSAPELQRQMREGLASTGQLRSGAATVANTNLSNQLAQQVGQGQREITAADLKARQDALTTALNMNDHALQQATGMDKGTLTSLFNSGREDLINEATQLIQIEQNRSQGIAGAYGVQAKYDLANDAAKSANSADLISQLAGLVGKGAGAYTGYKSAAAKKTV